MKLEGKHTRRVLMPWALRNVADGDTPLVPVCHVSDFQVGQLDKITHGVVTPLEVAPWQ